ncbi:TPA: hypothetical protein ACWZ76_004278 [Klebsiella pneumoniae]
MGLVVELVRYVAVNATNNTVITVWSKLLVRTETLLPAVVKPVVTLIKQHQRLHAVPGDIVKREFDRYVVIKNSHAEQALTDDERKELYRLGVKCAKWRRDNGKKPFECVVVEHDWPEYEPVWKAIEQRVDGPHPLPVMNKDVRSLVDAISQAALADDISAGCDISAGIFGPVFSQLIFQLAEIKRKSQLLDQLRDLMGYVQNGTDGIITLFQDDATLTYWVTHRTAGKKEHDWQEHAASLEQAIRNAYDKHGDN